MGHTCDTIWDSMEQYGTVCNSVEHYRTIWDSNSPYVMLWEVCESEWQYGKILDSVGQYCIFSKSWVPHLLHISLCSSGTTFLECSSASAMIGNFDILSVVTNPISPPMLHMATVWHHVILRMCVESKFPSSFYSYPLLGCECDRGVSTNKQFV